LYIDFIIFFVAGRDVDMPSVVSSDSPDPFTLAWVKTQNFNMRVDSAPQAPVCLGSLQEDITGVVRYCFTFAYYRKFINIFLTDADA
jgi:hypothetical protein